MNFRDLFTKGKAMIAKIETATFNALESLKGKITAGSETLIPWVSDMVDQIQKVAYKATVEIPLITADFDGPIGIAIASAIPNGIAIRDETIAVINRFLPDIQKIADPSIMNAIKLRLTAEIVKIEHGGIATIDKAILDVQQFYQAVEGVENIIPN